MGWAGKSNTFKRCRCSRTMAGVMELLPREQVAHQALLDTIRRGIIQAGQDTATPDFGRRKKDEASDTGRS